MNQTLIKHKDLESWVKTALAKKQDELPQYMTLDTAERCLIMHIKCAAQTSDNESYDISLLQTMLEKWFYAQPNTKDIKLNKRGCITKLPKQTAIENHRILWDWLAEETKRRKKIIKKDNYICEINPFIEKLEAHCWPCEYTTIMNQSILNSIDICEKCLFMWGNESDDTCIHVNYTHGLYKEWSNAETWETAYKYAKQIADINEK